MLDIIKLVTLKSIFIVLLVAGAANSSNAFGAGLDFLPQSKTKTITKRPNKAELKALAIGSKPMCIKMLGKVAYVNPVWTKLGIKKSACSKQGKIRQDYERALGVSIVYVDQSNLNTVLLKQLLKQ